MPSHPFFRRAGYTGAALAAVLALVCTVSRGADTLPDAASRGVVDEVRRLLDAGVPVDTRQEGTLWTPLLAAVRAGKRDIVVLLLDRGAKPDLAGANGYTPVMAATQTRNTTLLRLLLLRGANPNKATPTGLTPLMLAAGNKPGTRTEPADLECVKLLLRAGADPDRLHKSGVTALAVAEAQSKPTVAAYLKRFGTGGTGDATAITDGVLTGRVAYRERIAVSPGAFSVVRLLDIAPKNPVVLAQAVTVFAGKQVPVPFTLAYKSGNLAGRVNPRFALDARIVSGGAAQFRTAQAVPFSLSAPVPVPQNLLLIRATPDDDAGLAGEAITATDKACVQSALTRTGTVRLGDLETRYTASFLGGQLVRIVANSTQGDYGTRFDRLYFRDDFGAGNVPELRAAFLSAKRQARSLPALGTGETHPLSGVIESVTQKIILTAGDRVIATARTVGREKITVTPPDITAARNFARLLASDALRRR